LIRGREFEGYLEKALTLTGLKKPYLYRLMQVAEAWPDGIRSLDIISWGVHAILLREPDIKARTLLLRRAVAENWTQSDANKFFRKIAAETPLGPTKTFPSRLVHVKCPECEHVFPVRGNKTA
jgi:hypothetical protein